MPRLTIRKIAIFLLILFFVGIFSLLIVSKPFDDNSSIENSQFRTEKKLRFRHGKTFVPESLNFHKLDDDAYAVSVFLDDRNGNMGYRFVRVLMTLTKKDSFVCFVNSKKSSEVTIYELSENHNMKFGVFILNCKIPTSVTGGIKSIEVERDSDSNSLPLPINHHIFDESLTSTSISLSVCVPVIYGGFYSVERIIEFIEYSILQGVQRINLYIEPTFFKNPNMKKMLNHYANLGLLTYTLVDLPFSQNSIWYFGQLVTITDCLIKMTGTSKFTFFHDIDEFFVPTTNMTMLNTLETLFKDEKVGAQRVALKYMKLQDSKPPIILHNIQSEDRVETRFTKCVVRPEMVFEQGIHHTSRVIQDDYKIEDHDGSLLHVYHFKAQNYCCQNITFIANRYGAKLREGYLNAIRGILGET